MASQHAPGPDGHAIDVLSGLPIDGPARDMARFLARKAGHDPDEMVFLNDGGDEDFPYGGVPGPVWMAFLALA